MSLDTQRVRLFAFAHELWHVCFSPHVLSLSWQGMVITLLTSWCFPASQTYQRLPFKDRPLPMFYNVPMNNIYMHTYIHTFWIYYMYMHDRHYNVLLDIRYNVFISTNFLHLVHFQGDGGSGWEPGWSIMPSQSTIHTLRPGRRPENPANWGVTLRRQ